MGNIDVLGGGGGQNAKEKRLLYIESPDFKSPHVFISAYIIYNIPPSFSKLGGEFYYTDHRCMLRWFIFSHISCND